MKITTRIITGYGLFVIVLLGLTGFQMWTVHRMQEINQNLRDINFENASMTFEAQRAWAPVSEFTEKYLGIEDPKYEDKLKGYKEDFEDKLKQLDDGQFSKDERDEVDILISAYHDFEANLEQLKQDLPVGGFEKLPQPFLDEMESLAGQIESVENAIWRSIAKKLEQSEQTSSAAQVVLISITGTILSVTILVSLLIIRSISRPLAHLTEGTRAITEGKYYYRLDTSRNDEFAQLAKDFNTMIRRLSELDELKKDFISHVSHELKSPLASMRETVQLMIDQIPGPLTDKQKRLLELNLQSGDRLTAMIRNLLDLSKIEAGTMDYELRNQDLAPSVMATVAEFEVRAAEKQVMIETSLPDAPLPVKCDSDRIVQVIVNLVGNAVKFSPNGGHVRIRLESVSEIPKTMPESWRFGMTVPEQPEYFGLLSIADSGPGIADVDKSRIFEKFHQVQKGKKVEGQGVGLGLAICHTIVQAHRGAVWVEDNPGGGSCFFLLLSPGKEEDRTLRASQPL